MLANFFIKTALKKRALNGNVGPTLVQSLPVSSEEFEKLRANIFSEYYLCSNILMLLEIWGFLTSVLRFI